MLKLGEKGAISQRDNETYAVAPHIPCGVVTPEQLRKLADVAEKYGAKALKITGTTRIAIVGLKETDQAFVMVERILHYYKANAKKVERLGALIERVGLDALSAAVS